MNIELEFCETEFAKMENISWPLNIASEIGCENIRGEDIEHFSASKHDAQFIKHTTNKN